MVETQLPPPQQPQLTPAAREVCLEAFCGISIELPKNLDKEYTTSPHYKFYDRIINAELVQLILHLLCGIFYTAILPTIRHMDDHDEDDLHAGDIMIVGFRIWHFSLAVLRLVQCIIYYHKYPKYSARLSKDNTWGVNHLPPTARCGSVVLFIFAIAVAGGALTWLLVALAILCEGNVDALPMLIFQFLFALSAAAPLSKASLVMNYADYSQMNPEQPQQSKKSSPSSSEYGGDYEQLV